MPSPVSPVPETESTLEKCLKPFPASTKIYTTGSRPDLRVPFRAVSLQPTRDFDGSLRAN